MPGKDSKSSKSKSTSLVIVPHRDLAYQYQHWIHLLYPDDLSISQLCVRGDPLNPIPTHLIGKSLAQVLGKQSRPRILLATPQALVELLEATLSKPLLPRSKPNPSVLPPLPISSLDLRINTIVADEMDELLKLPPKYASPKELKSWERHKPPIIRILDAAYGSADDLKGSTSSQVVGILPRPQLVLTSATLGNQVRRFLFGQTNWMAEDSEDGSKNAVVRLDLSRSQLGNEGDNARSRGHSIDDTVVEHSCVVVRKDGSVRNIDMVEPPVQLPLKTTKGKSKGVKQAQDAETPEKPIAPPTTPSEPLLLSMATAFALDVPSLALLVLPSTYNIRKTVDQLKELGVDARPVDLKDDEKGKADLAGGSRSSFTANFVSQVPAGITSDRDNGPSAEQYEPTLLVSTLATVRGLDFPNLTHVFLLDTSVITNLTAYEHIAGRVGRFGKPGKIVTFVQESKPGAENSQTKPSSNGDDLSRVRDEEQRMRRIFNRLGIAPVDFSAVE
ncbi:hypothetical protein FRC02_001488 [Tulasnella sp. 418]|nr:hypothetical protein FRC02_001488 [Tulasnella sp. 418]